MLTCITKLKALYHFTTLSFKLCRKICTCAIYFYRIAVFHSPIDLYVDDCTLCMYTCIYMYNTIYMASHLHPIHWHILYIQEYIIYRHILYTTCCITVYLPYILYTCIYVHVYCRAALSCTYVQTVCVQSSDRITL